MPSSRHRLFAVARAQMGCGLSWWMGRRGRVRWVVACVRSERLLALLALGLPSLGMCTLPWNTQWVRGAGIALFVGAIGCAMAAALVRFVISKRWVETVSISEMQEQPTPLHFLMNQPCSAFAQAPTIFRLEWCMAVWLFDPAINTARAAVALDATTRPAGAAPTVSRRL